MGDPEGAVAEPPQPWRAVMARAAFPEAARRLAGNMIQACEEDASLCTVFKDAGAYMTAMSAMYLDGAGGLTLARLKDICAGSGFMSRGRASLLLQVLVHIGYLQPATTARGTAYRTTAKFVGAWLRHIQLALLAAAVMEPTLIALCGELDSPEVFAAFLAVQARRLLQLAQGGDPAPGFRRAFLHPYAGSQVLWVLVLLGDPQEFPPRGPLPIVLEQTAVQFGVSRMQVRRVLAGAEKEDLLRYQAGGLAVFQDAGLQSIGQHFASQLDELIETGREVMRNANPRSSGHF